MKIGVDAGGTKTTAQLFNVQNKLIATARSGYGNPLIDYQQALSHIEQAVQALLETAKITHSEIEVLAIGIAGAEGGGFLDKMSKYFEKKFSFPVVTMSDLFLSHIATFSGQNGTMLISGTGTSVLTKNQGKFQQKGGWGHILGDEGSGYWLGLAMLKVLTHYFDGNTLPSEMYVLIETLLEKAPTKQALIDLVYRQPKANVAALASLTTDFEETTFMQNLMSQCADHLAELVISSLDKTSAKSLSLALEGSVVTKNKFIQEKLVEKLKRKGYQVSIVPAISATYGVMYL